MKLRTVEKRSSAEYEGMQKNLGYQNHGINVILLNGKNAFRKAGKRSAR